MRRLRTWSLYSKLPHPSIFFLQSPGAHCEPVPRAQPEFIFPKKVTRKAPYLENQQEYRHTNRRMPYAAVPIKTSCALAWVIAPSTTANASTKVKTVKDMAGRLIWTRNKRKTGMRRKFTAKNTMTTVPMVARFSGEWKMMRGSSVFPGPVLLLRSFPSILWSNVSY